MDAQEAELYVDRLAAVAASTASDLEELSTGMSKVAAAANAMGVGEDQLAAQLSTIVSVTRNAPESVGTALKTIYSRIADIKAGISEDDVSLGEYSGKLAGMGIEVLDANKQLRDMGSVMEEVGEKWETFTREQQVALAQIMGGARQYTMLMALFENWDEYTRTMEVAAKAQGTLQQQQEIYLESTRAHIEQLGATMEKLYSSLIDPDSIITITDALKTVVEATTTWVDAMGGGIGVLKQLGSVGLVVFNKQISEGILKTIDNLKLANQNAKSLQETFDLNARFQSATSKDDELNLEATALREKLLENGIAGNLNAEEFEKIQSLTEKYVNIGAKLVEQKQTYQELDDLFQKLTGSAGSYADEVENVLDRPNADKFLASLTEIENKLNKVKGSLKESKEDYSDFLRNSREGIKTDDIELVKQAEDSLVNSLFKVEDSFKALEEHRDWAEKLIGPNVFQRIDELQRRFNEALSEMGDVNDEESQSKLRVIVSNVRNEFDQLTDNIKRKVTETKNSVHEDMLNGVSSQRLALQEIEQAHQKALQEIEDEWKKSSTRIKLQSAVAVVGAIGGIASTLESLGDIVTSDDLDIGKKLTRSMTLIPNMVMHLSGLNKTLNLIKVSTDAAKLAEAGFTTTTIAGTDAVIGFNKALLANPLSWIVIAITAGVAAFGALANIIKRNEQAQEEERKATLENAEAKKEELKTLQDLTKAYEESYQGYQDGTASKQEMLDATRAICEELGIEEYQVKLLAGRYGELAEEIKAASAEKQEAAVQEIAKGYQASADAFDEDVSKSKKYVTDNGDISSWGYSFKFNGENAEATEYVDNLISKLQEVGVEAARAGDEMMIFNMSSSQAIQAYKVLNEAQTEVGQNEDWSLNFDNFMDSVKESAPEVINSINNIKSSVESLLLMEIQDSSAENQDEFLEVQEHTIARIKELYKNSGISWEDVFGSEEELESYVLGILGEVEGLNEQASAAAIKNLAKENLSKTKFDTGKVDNLKDEIIPIIAEMEFNEDQTERSVLDQIEYAQEIAENNKINLDITPIESGISILKDKDSFDDLTKEEQEIVSSMMSTLDQLPAKSEAFINALEEFNSLSEAGSLRQIEYLQDIADIQGQNNLKSLDDAEKLYADYSTKIVAIKEQLDILYNKQDKGIITDEELSQLNSLEDELYVATEAKKALDRQFDNNVSVNVEMDAVDNIVSMGDQFVDQAVKMQSAAELIGEGFQVAAKDAETLFEIFPELADQAGILADGTIQLNQGVVQSILGDQSKILVGDSETKIAQIDNEIEVLEAKKAASEAELKLAEAVAKGNVDLTKQEIEKISSGRESLVNYLMQLGLDETNANKAYTAIMAGNMEEYSRVTASVAQSIDSNLTTAIQQATTNIGENSVVSQENLINIGRAAAQAGKSIKAMGMGESVEPENAHGISTTVASTMKSYNSAKALFKGGTAQKTTATKPFVDEWISNIKLDISEYTKGIAQLKAIRIKILQTQAAAQNAMNNASSGLGGSYKPSSNKGSSSSKDNAKKEEKEKESDYIDLLEDEWDIYHDINIQIETISRELDRISKAQDKLTGKDLINNLDKQLDILEKQKQVYEDKIELAKQEAGAFKESLKGFGVTFNEDGQISNYALALQKQLEATNDVIARYNSLSADQQTDSEKEKVEAAKKQYEAFKDLIDNYEELINSTIPDLEDNIADALDKQIEIQINKFKMSVDLRLNMAEAERDWNDFKKKVIDKVKDDDILGSAKADYADLLSYYNTAGSGTGPVQALTGQINDTLAQLKEMDNNLDKTSSIYGQNRAQAMEDLKNYMNELMDQLSSVEDLIDSIEKSYLDMIDEANSKFDEHIKGYDFINDLIEHNKNVIELLYGEDAYGELDKFYQRQEENNNKNLDFLRKEADFWLQKMQAEEEGSEAWKAYKENWEEAIKDLNSSVEDSIQTIVDRYGNLINKVFDDLNKKVTSGMGLEYVNDEWDLIKKNADEYLDTINASFAIDKLRGKFQDALNNTDGLQNQQRLNELMQQQLGDLETREKLTQYDVDRAEKLLDIEVKRIALQDAQKNKSKMRLKRDASGNYSYQFVSDEESILQAQQDLADAQNSLYNFDKNAYQENLNGIYDIYSEFQNKLMELYADQTLTEEEREAKKALLIEQYQELLTAKTEQNAQIRNNLENSAFLELSKMYGVNINEFQNMVDEQKNILLGDLIPGWNDGIQQMVDKFVAEGGLIPVCSDAFKDLEEITNQYKDSLEGIQETGGISFDNLANGYDKNIELANKLQQENQELINQYDQQIAAIQRVIQEVQSLANMYEVAYKNAVNASKAAYLYWQEQNRQDAANSANKGGGAGSSASTSGGANSSTSSGNGASSTTSGGAGNSGSGGSSASPGKSVTVDNIKVGDKLKYTGGLYYYDSWGSGPAGNRGAGSTVTVSNIAKGNKYPISVTSSNSAYGWLLPSQLQKLKTGGYTGEWGSSGKLAMLHEKELVLNASDTKNMLDAVSVVRSITDSFSNNVFNMLGTFSGNARNIVEALNPGANSINNTTINAEFPNVTNHNEIEEAIKNLSNIASQRAMKKR